MLRRDKCEEALGESYEYVYVETSLYLVNVGKP
jgi:hypothetical protein